MRPEEIVGLENSGGLWLVGVAKYESGMCVDMCSVRFRGKIAIRLVEMAACGTCLIVVRVRHTSVDIRACIE